MRKTFAVGHLSIGYLLGKVFGNFLKIQLNWGLLFTVSVLPDFDLLFSSFMQHRGATHSLMFFLIVSIPFFVIYGKKAVPYSIALLSHSLIGDIFSGGIQFFWPFSREWVSISNFSTVDNFNIGLELSFFVICIVVMISSKDFQKIFSNKTKRIYWIIPTGTILGSLVVYTRSYASLPFLLVIPSLFFLVIFIYRLTATKNK